MAARTDQGDIWMTLEMSDLTFKAFRVGDIVSVDMRKILTTACGDRLV